MRALLSAALVLLATCAIALADEDPYVYHVNYYDSDGNQVGYWWTGCNRTYARSGTTTDNFRVTRFRVCAPDWYGADQSCYIDGAYYDHCPMLPSGISTPVSPFMEPCPKDHLTTLGHTCCVFAVDPTTGGCPTGPNP